MRIDSAISPPAGINAGVPQGTVTAPLLFNLFISGQPNSNQTLVGDFADDKAIIANSADPNLASLYVQNHLHLLETWYREWRIKMNENKSTHCTFTLRHGTRLTLFFNDQTLPNA